VEQELFIDDVVKSYRRGRDTVPVLDHVSVVLERFEFLAVTGPSGSGKTTLLNLIGGLDTPDSGIVRVAGERIDTMSNAARARWRARSVGFVFQFYNLIPALSAWRNVELPLLTTTLTAAERKRHVDAAMTLVGLADRARHVPAELSGGQQQRVAIARALVADPRVLVCDEPTGDLDRASADAVLELLATLAASGRSTIVMVTHDPRAAGYATREIHIDKGVVMQPQVTPAQPALANV